MNWDQIRVDLGRALGGSFPEEAEEIVAVLEKRLHHAPEEERTRSMEGVLVRVVEDGGWRISMPAAAAFSRRSTPCRNFRSSDSRPENPTTR